jgi:LysM repeat protein
MIFKRYGGTGFGIVTKPISITGLFLVRWVGIPIYRFTFFVRHFFYRIARPTKHKLLSIITNRYTVHAMMVVLVVAVMFVNISTREVRAQTFGQKSILHSLIAVDDSQDVEIVTASDSVVSTGTSVAYLDDTILDANLHIDQNYLDESYVTSTTGGAGAVSSVPIRDKIETYIVQEGDTLGQISEKFSLNLSTVLWANNLTFRSTIQPGQSLVILPADGLLYKVRSGDTLSKISQRYGVEPEKILEQNKLASADRLSIGDELLIPGGEPISQAPKRSSSVANLFVSPSATPPVEGYWLWPTDWHTITQYYGWRHTGVDIDGDYTTNSYAVRDGVVIYSGWRGGYGLTVEVDHGDGYITRYAHHSKNFVSVGDVVKTGDALARTGTTGRSTGTHLHFEVIKKGKFQNPLDYVR